MPRAAEAPPFRRAAICKIYLGRGALDTWGLEGLRAATRQIPSALDS